MGASPRRARSCGVSSTSLEIFGCSRGRTQPDLQIFVDLLDSQDTMYTNVIDPSLRYRVIETPFLAKNSVMLYLHMLADLRHVYRRP